MRCWETFEFAAVNLSGSEDFFDRLALYGSTIGRLNKVYHLTIQRMQSGRVRLAPAPEGDTAGT
jgi:hypothetical protein